MAGSNLCDTLLPQKHVAIHVTDKRFIPQFRFRLEPFGYNAHSYYAFRPPCRLVVRLSRADGAVGGLRVLGREVLWGSMGQELEVDNAVSLCHALEVLSRYRWGLLLLPLS